MAIDIKRYQELKTKSEQAKTAVDRATGKLEEQMAKLKAEFGVGTLEEAEVLLAKLQKEEQEAEQAYNTELAAFETKWQGKL